MAIIVKDENNTRISPIYIKTNETFPNQNIGPSKVFSAGVAAGCSIVVVNNEPHILGAGEIYVDPITTRESVRYIGHYKLSNGEWINIGRMPNFKYGSSVVLNDEIHILGASLLPDLSDHTLYYKYNGSSWDRMVGTLPYNFKNGSAVALNGEIHILGGINSKKSHYKYLNGEWVEVSTLPVNFYSSSALIFNNEIHILGGGSIYKYSNGEWIKIDDLPKVPDSYSSYGYSCIVCDEELHLFRTIGRNLLGNRNYFNKHYKYIYNGNYWKELPDIMESTDPSFDMAFCTSPDTFSAFVIESEDKSSKTIECAYLAELITPGVVSPYLLESIDYYTSSYIWEPGSELLYDFCYGSAVVLNNEIHILGSSDNPEAHYKYSNGEWVPVSTLPYDFYQGDAVVLNNEIHILGSSDNPEAHYKYSNGEWVPVSTLPFNFYIGGAAVVLNNEIHVLGTGGNRTKSHFKYSNGEWTELNQLTFVFHRGSAVVYNNTIHVLGSLAASQESDRAKQHYKYVISTDSWVEDTPLPYGFYSGSTIILNGEMHILGGNWTQTSHYKYLNGEWVEVDTLPYDFYNGSAVVLNDEINMLGGSGYGENYYIYKENPLTKHLFNKIKGIWAKVKVPTYDQYGNCTIVEQAKKVKAVWVGGPDNKAKRVFY